MCGIAGLMANSSLDGADALIDGFLQALAHRGPDGEGVHRNGHIALAHRRLSIIDLDGGAQPIISPRGNVVAVNGEIYNYVELKAEMDDAAFQTASDSEVPLILYETHGEAFVDKLRGMYAIALYDAQKDELLLHRDPYGIKPLYYAQTADLFCFASEPEALFQEGLIAPEIDRAKAAEFLQLKFTTGRGTVFDGVERVLPGETLIIKGGQVVRRSRINPFVSAKTTAIGQKPASAALSEHIADSVGVHVRADVPYGVFLSGGVDSCSIVAAMMQLGLKGFPCYTVRFTHASVHDELSVARKVAHGAGAEHVELAIDEEAFWRTLPRAIAAVDDPVSDPAMVPFYLLAERASQDVKVVLTGAGGDEVFAGYRRYDRAALGRLAPTKSLRSKGQFDGADFADFSGVDWRAGYAASEAAARANTVTPLQCYQATDGADYLPHFGLNLLDRCLMAHGVEGRTPLLDTRLSRFAFNLPDHLKLRWFKGKWLLRKWLQDALPAAEPFAPKRGFSVPVVDWVAARAPELADVVADQPGVGEMFDADKVRALFLERDHPQGSRRWPILHYAIWHQIHIRGDRAFAL